MKRSFIAILFCPLFFISNSLAQWEILNEGFKGSINTIDFVNENVGWIAGSNGTLLKTIDGGETWKDILINENWHISQIDFINESTCWAIGRNGPWSNCTYPIWKSSDSGQLWFQQFVTTEFMFNSIYAVNANIVYAIGGNKIYKTTNGGTDWVNISPNLPNRNYNSLWFQNSQMGVVVGNFYDGTIDKGIILRTTNGGSTWDENIVNEFNSINDLQFLDNENGYFRANLDTTNYICKTEDILLSWVIKTVNPYSISSYQFLDNNTAYAIMGDSISSDNVKKSIDGGMNWDKIFSPIPGVQLIEIYFSTPTTGFIFNRFSLLSSFDYGITWEVKKINFSINDISFIDKNKGFMVGGFPSGSHHVSPRQFLLSTTNEGINWVFKCFVGDYIPTCILVNDSVGFMLTDNCIYKTNNFGNDWLLVNEPNFDSLGYAIRGNDIGFLNEQIGFTVGSYYSATGAGAGIMLTTNGGDNWDLGWKFPDTSINNIEYSFNLLSLCFTPTASWSVGESGKMLKYTSQTSWVQQSSVTDLPLNKVFFSDENHGWIVGGYHYWWVGEFQNILLKTTDGGDSWVTVPGIPYLFRDMKFLDNNFGWAIGYDSSGVGGILKSTDGGNSWTIDTGNLSAKLNALHIKDNYGWAVGENGLILRTTNAGLTWVEDENETFPTEFALEQNYPNPFNPTTKIKYSIPTTPASLPLLNKEGIEGWFVTLKIYDVLGREVATLVNEEKKPGIYEIEFNGTNLSSGIYLYKLIAGNLKAVRKAILLK